MYFSTLFKENTALTINHWNYFKFCNQRTNIKNTLNTFQLYSYLITYLKFAKTFPWCIPCRTNFQRRDRTCSFFQCLWNTGHCPSDIFCPHSPRKCPRECVSSDSEKKQRCVIVKKKIILPSQHTFSVYNWGNFLIYAPKLYSHVSE